MSYEGACKQIDSMNREMSSLRRELIHAPQKSPAGEMALSLIDTFRVNVDNPQLSDADFRQLVRNSIPLVAANRES